MKNIFRLITILILFAMVVSAQSVFCGSANSGYFLKHSENSQPITKTKEFQWYIGGSLNCEFRLQENRYFQLEFGYSKAKLEWQDSIVNEFGEQISTFKSQELSEIYFPIDIRYLFSDYNLNRYGIGLSIIPTKHTLIINSLIDGESVQQIDDTFTSFGLGPSFYVRYGKSIPCTNLFIFTALTVRYITGIKFIGEGRDFSNYEHNYLQAQLSIGIGKKK